MEAKYALPFYLLPLLSALVLTRTPFDKRGLATAVGISFVIAAPSAVWQIAHGLPFLEMLRT